MSEAQDRLNRNPETKAKLEEAIKNIANAKTIEITNDATKHLRPRWNIHLCGKWSFDEICQEYGVDRLHLNSPFGCVIIALSRDGWSQMWLPWKKESKFSRERKVNYRDWFSPIVYHPARRR